MSRWPNSYTSEEWPWMDYNDRPSLKHLVCKGMKYGPGHSTVVFSYFYTLPSRLGRLGRKGRPIHPAQWILFLFFNMCVFLILAQDANTLLALDCVYLPAIFFSFLLDSLNEFLLQNVFYLLRSPNSCFLIPGCLIFSGKITSGLCWIFFLVSNCMRFWTLFVSSVDIILELVVIAHIFFYMYILKSHHCLRKSDSDRILQFFLYTIYFF